MNTAQVPVYLILILAVGLIASKNRIKAGINRVQRRNGYSSRISNSDAVDAAFAA